MSQGIMNLMADGRQKVKLSGSVTGKGTSDTVTRPNDTNAYAAGDVVSTAAGEIMEFASVGAVDEVVMILGSRLRVDVNAVPSGMSNFRLHLYNAAPTAIADNAAYNLPSGDRAKYLGYVTLSTPVDLGDTLYSEDDNLNFTAKLAGTSLYGILATTAGYTPSANTVKTVTLNITGV